MPLTCIASNKTAWKRFRDILIFAAVVVVISQWQSRNMLASNGTVIISQQVLPDLTGQSQTLLANDKPTLVYFFAPWCRICSLSIGNLDSVDTDNLHIVRVALDYQSTAEVAAFIESNQVQGGVLLGNTTTAQQFKIQGYPSYYLIDQNQRVVSRAFGYSTSLGLNIRKWIH